MRRPAAYDDRNVIKEVVSQCCLFLKHIVRDCYLKLNDTEELTHKLYFYRVFVRFGISSIVFYSVLCTLSIT